MQRKPTEAENRRNLAKLLDLVQLPGNEVCADCLSGASEWASVNLGVFLCLRCSGLHRQLGTHISKVRSVRLDSWQPDQVMMMESVGNLAARQIYEATLKKSGRRFDPANDIAVLNFIKEKYEHKRWFRQPKSRTKKSKSRRSKRSTSGGKRSSRERAAPVEAKEKPLDSSDSSSDEDDLLSGGSTAGGRRGSQAKAAPVKAKEKPLDSSDSSSDEDDLLGGENRTSNTTRTFGATSDDDSDDSDDILGITDEQVLNAEVERLRRLPANCVCANCSAQDAMGFRQIAVQFGTFVCSYCKSAHQAFSHRIKSVGMSTFNAAEVQLARLNGNQHAREVWLGRLKRKEINKQCPTPQDRTEVWHNWIKRIYIDKDFYMDSTMVSKRKPAKKRGHTRKKSSLSESEELPVQPEKSNHSEPASLLLPEESTRGDLDLASFFSSNADSSSGDEDTVDPNPNLCLKRRPSREEVRQAETKSNIMSMFQQGQTASSMGTTGSFGYL